VKTIQVYQHTPHLKKVIELWRAHSDTLGFFPDGAFDEYAGKGRILAAVSDDDQLLGYLIFRLARHHATIVQFCVDPASRGVGVAAVLLSALKGALPAHIASIRLSCRRDFPATNTWPRLGFHAASERPGRSAAGALLTTWLLDLGVPDLFSELRNRDAPPIVVVIDAHLFFDVEVSSETCFEETSLLFRTWREEDLEPWITDELFNEINRNKDLAARTQLRQRAQDWRRVANTPESFAEALSQVNLVTGHGRSIRDESDRRQLAHAIAGGATVFATRDEGLLALAPELFRTLGINVLHPSAVLTHLDEILDEARYSPRRLAGTASRAHPLRTSELEEVVREVSRANLLPFREYRDLVRSIMGDSSGHFLVVRDRAQSIMGSLGYRLSKLTKIVAVDLLYASPDLRIASTLSSHLLQQAVNFGVESDALVVQVSEVFSSAVDPIAASDMGFILAEGRWVKFLFDGVHSISSCIAWLSDGTLMHSQFKAHCDALKGILLEHRDDLASTTLQVARAIWPGHVMDLRMPAFIVPIRPNWAKDLFDVGLAGADLFGGREDLLLRTENVYYRSRQNSNGLCAPCRLLWYVSGARSRGSADTAAIRAVSLASEVRCEAASDLFRRYRRLGVYEWSDIVSLSKGSSTREIMAIRFGPTRMLREGVSFRKIQELLAASGGRSHPLVSPVRLSDEAFVEILRSADGQQ